MLCPRCHHANPAASRFCAQCGTPLARVCPSCGAEVAAGSRFCGRCGAAQSGAAEEPPRPPGGSPLSPGAPVPTPGDESEIKQATVLCCELVWEADVEAEVLHEVLNQFLQLARAEIGRFGGAVNQILGRGALALFGAPEAHEDHAERAVLAASALRQRLAQTAGEVKATFGTGWTVRMGLDTGSVIMGGAESTAVGEAIDGARRLLGAAPPDAVLLSEALGRQVRSLFQLAEARELEAGAPRPPSTVWRLTDAAPSLAAPRRFSGWKRSPFVGREREMTLLDELRGYAEAGQGQVVGIVGDPGSGKSRLLYEHSSRLRDLPVSYLRGKCLSYASGIPYFPFIDMIRRASQAGESHDPPVVAAKLSRSLEAVGLDPDELLPYFLELLGLREGAEALDTMEPQAIQAHTFSAMRRMILAASRRSLVVIEVEDLHWIDETSDEFLATLIEETSGARILLLLTYRPGYTPGWLQKTFATQITLRRLSADESRVVAGSILGQDGAVPEQLTSIVEEAEGNPFFLEELARSLAGKPEDGAEPRIPSTIQGVLMARIDRLPREHKRLLQVGSVLDRELSLRLLQEVWDRPQTLPELLADLQRREFLYTAPSEEPGAYCFRHALTQEVAYHSLLKSRRRELHARVAQALEALFADRLDEVYDRLIYHYPRAGDSAKTVHYLVLFAERAAHHYAHAEAAKALRQALTHAERLPAEVRDRRSLEVLLQLAESLFPLARFPETLELFLAHEPALEAVADPSIEARFRFWLAHTYTYLGSQEDSRRQGQLAIDASQACGDEATEGKAWYVLGRNAFWAGDFSNGLEQSRRAVVLLERSGEPWWQGQAYWVAGFHHWALGQFEQGLQTLRQAAGIGEALDDYRLDPSWSIGFVQASLGNWQAGIELGLQAIERSHDPLNTAVATGFLGHAYLRKGDLEAAIQAMRESIERLAKAGMRQLLGWLTAFLAEAYLAAGRVEEAREAADEALRVSREAHFDYAGGLAQRILGRVALATGEPAEARACLDEALETFRSLGAPFEIARTRLARAAAADTRRSAADDLAEAHRLFRELDATTYMREAEAMAEELGLEASSVRSS